MRGNFGYSYAKGEPVRTRIGARLGPTLELMGAALLISTIVGVLLGVGAALRANTFWDYLLSVVSLLGLSIPSFFCALIALYLFAARWPILPAFGMRGRGGAPAPLDTLYHLILPATTLALELTASMTRYARAAVLDVLRADYVTTAREGAGRTARDLTACFSQRAADADHGRLAAPTAAGGRGDYHRDDVSVAGHRVALHSGDSIARLRGSDGVDARRRHPGTALESAGRRLLCRR